MPKHRSLTKTSSSGRPAKKEPGKEPPSIEKTKASSASPTSSQEPVSSTPSASTLEPPSTLHVSASGEVLRGVSPAPSSGPSSAPSSSPSSAPAVSSSNPPQLENIVRLRLLEHVPPEDLLEFLSEYREYLASRSVFLEGIAVTEAWRKQLFKVLTQVDPAMPAKLQQSLVDIADVSNERAYDESIELADQHQIVLPLFDKPNELVQNAFRIYLDQPKIFRQMLARQLATKVERYAEFYPRKHLPLPELTEFRLSRLVREISMFYESHNRTGFCDLCDIERGDEIQFHIIHGRPPRSHSTIENGKTRSRCSYVPDRHDLVVYDRLTGRLAVGAQRPFEQEFYREIFGRVFFGAPSHFCAHLDVNARPLIEEGASAFSAAGVVGLREVRLRELRVRLPIGKKHIRTIVDENIIGFLADRDVKDLLNRGRVTYMRLDFHLERQRRIPQVFLIPPDNMIYDRRLGAFQAREFLLQRGFVVLPQVEYPRAEA